ncbi:metallophosphoesterase [Patulibacter brassicae]|uniref:Metallophosphoesterase n=1 Tax=Patulibacter brassicae TaxID=1705717 RepID=A0ABU4VMH9_9ACTN|nr:metallophosphoesterase [Patulibacter brassicae]MDX8153040.1 metallophosphoesterase [Patulibacter brassicae]
MTRIAAIGDLHGHLPPVPDCDVLVLAGDLTPAHDHDPAFQRTWLDTTFRAWLAAAPAGHVVAIAGNHDFLFERAPVDVPELPWTYLEDEHAEVAGLVFWGSPWTPWFFDWAFNAPRGDDEEAFLRERCATAPDRLDVAVVHGPPRGYGDRTAAGLDVGSRAFLDLVDDRRPALALFGHIHEGRGRWQRDGTILANVAAVDLEYALRPEPFLVVDL